MAQDDTLKAIAEESQLSIDAVKALLVAFQSGGGSMAQFNHSELGGMGQWSSGMLMIGDFGNHSLKAKVQEACEKIAAAVQKGNLDNAKVEADLSGIEAQSILKNARSAWWDESLGTPSSVGGQNDIQYAYFPTSHRLAVKEGAKVTIFDTGNHEIRGVSQQQGSTRSLEFQSQHGTLRANDLRIVN